MRTKKGHAAKGTGGPEKPPGHNDSPPVMLSKMCRGYSMKVRGEVPADIVERISGLHSAALRAAGRPERSRNEGTDESNDKGEEDGNNVEVPMQRV